MPVRLPSRFLEDGGFEELAEERAVTSKRSGVDAKKDDSSIMSARYVPLGCWRGRRNDPEMNTNCRGVKARFSTFCKVSLDA